jgi:chromosome segregation ATPase
VEKLLVTYLTQHREEELKFLRELTNKEAIVSDLSHKVELFAIQESKLETSDKQYKLEIEIVKSYYTDSQKQLETKANALQEKYSSMLSDYEMSKAEIEKYKNIIDERALQINILMETIQTLQGTDPKEQQIVNLTSQLNLARSTDAALERRIVELNADVAVLGHIKCILILKGLFDTNELCVIATSRNDICQA